MRKWPYPLLLLGWYCLLPLLLVTAPLAIRARRRATRLPEAPGPRTGCAGEGSQSPLQLLVVGESPVAGVGVSDSALGLPAQLAIALSRRLGRPVAWQALGWNGIRMNGLVRALDQSALPRADVVLWLGGVNDTTAMTQLGHWREQVQSLGQMLERGSRGRLWFCQVPPMEHFTGIPQPFRFGFGLRASLLDRQMARVCQQWGWSRTAIQLPRVPEMLAEDGFHPSAAGCEQLAGYLADELVKDGELVPSPGPATPAG